jgi:hypothetical protein
MVILVFPENLFRGKANDWSCRAGGRYRYVREDGRVHYCSQQRGQFGLPLDEYTADDLEREYHGVKPCAPLDRISCLHQVCMIDQFRDRPREALARFFPANSGLGQAYDPPATNRALTWMFLPPRGSKPEESLGRAWRVFLDRMAPRTRGAAGSICRASFSTSRRTLAPFFLDHQRTKRVLNLLRGCCL